MPIAEHYLLIKQAHVGLVATSGALFALRGAAVLAGQAWAMQAPWRRLSYAVDTLLLGAGAALWAILSIGPLQAPWLGTKLLLLLLYIVLGSLALKRGRTAGVRRVSYALALLTFLFMAGVAVRHQPWGWLG